MNKTIVALLTGRGNNTLHDKNILPVLGKPLVQYPGIAAKKSDLINSYWISSDCNKILDAANSIGFEKIKRPLELSKPTSLHIDAIDHAIGHLKKQNIHPDILVVLLANSVTIKTEWIDECINSILKDNRITACVPVYKDMDHHPYRAKTVDSNGYLVPFFDFKNKEISSNRQDLPVCYFLSHNFWVLNINSIERSKGQQPWEFMGDKVKYIEVDEAFDVHTESDLVKSEKWLIKEKMVSNEE